MRVIYNEGEHIEVIENVQKVEVINNTGRVLHYTSANYDLIHLNPNEVQAFAIKLKSDK